MNDLIEREKAIEALVNLTCFGIEEMDNLCNASVADSEGWIGGVRDSIREIETIPSAEPERKTGEWIPFTMRELTDEEREENPEWDWVFTCELPADGETVLLTNGKYVWEDMFCCDDGCYFDKADDIEDYDGYAWMPMPEPWRGDK